MILPPGSRTAVAGAVVMALAFVFTGVLARPLVVTGVVLLAAAALQARRAWRRELRVFTETRRPLAAVLLLAAIGLAGFWASAPFIHRRIVLDALASLTDEGRQIERDFARTGGAPGPQGAATSRVQDWHHRVEAWVGDELGPYYESRLATPEPGTTYPPNLPPGLRVFWDILETDLNALTTFHGEFSPWLFSVRR